MSNPDAQYSDTPKQDSLFLSRNIEVLKNEIPDLIQEIFEREAIVTMGMTDVFDSNYTKGQLKQAQSNDVLNMLSPGRINFNELNSNIERYFNKVDVAGDPTYPCKFSKSISIALQPSFFAAMMLFSKIKSEGWLNLELSSDFLHSKNLYDRVSNSDVEPDFFVLSIATAVKEGIFHDDCRIEYFPLCIMPQSTHRVIAPRNNKCKEQEISSGEYYLLLDSPGTGLVYFDELKKSQKLNARKVGLNHVEPKNLRNVLECGDYNTRAISWFPHYDIHVNYHDCVILDQHKNNLSHQGCVLLAHKRYLNSEMPLKLSHMIKKAWYLLLNKEKDFKTSVYQVLSDDKYAKSVFKSSGLYV